mmetsp:Transcript_11556/g.31186  ORF Transcript_11556/g.31186 Transcript_11556/m.31186 type:complete len:235 (+) Transcript_11556:276-980(+)
MRRPERRSAPRQPATRRASATAGDGARHASGRPRPRYSAAQVNAGVMPSKATGGWIQTTRTELLRHPGGRAMRWTAVPSVGTSVGTRWTPAALKYVETCHWRSAHMPRRCHDAGSTPPSWSCWRWNCAVLLLIRVLVALKLKTASSVRMTSMMTPAMISKGMRSCGEASSTRCAKSWGNTVSRKKAARLATFSLRLPDMPNQSLRGSMRSQMAKSTGLRNVESRSVFQNRYLNP